MNSLIQFQRDWMNRLQNDQKNNSTPSFRVYANAYRARLIESLSDDFWRTEEHLSEVVFNQSIEEFLKAHGSRRFNLGEVSLDFADFLLKKKISNSSVLLDLAETLSWNIFLSPSTLGWNPTLQWIPTINNLVCNNTESTQILALSPSEYELAQKIFNATKELTPDLGLWIQSLETILNASEVELLFPLIQKLSQFHIIQLEVPHEPN